MNQQIWRLEITSIVELSPAKCLLSAKLCQAFPIHLARRHQLHQYSDRTIWKYVVLKGEQSTVVNNFESWNHHESVNLLLYNRRSSSWGFLWSGKLMPADADRCLVAELFQDFLLQKRQLSLHLRRAADYADFSPKTHPTSWKRKKNAPMLTCLHRFRMAFRCGASSPTFAAKFSIGHAFHNSESPTGSCSVTQEVCFCRVSVLGCWKVELHAGSNGPTLFIIDDRCFKETAGWWGPRKSLADQVHSSVSWADPGWPTKGGRNGRMEHDSTCQIWLIHKVSWMLCWYLFGFWASVKFFLTCAWSSSRSLQAFVMEPHSACFGGVMISKPHVTLGRQEVCIVSQ